MSGRNSGITIVEVVAAATMLAVLLGSSVHVMRSLATQQEAAARRAMALQTVEAILEDFANRPWDELTPESASHLLLPDVANTYLPGASLKATVTDDSEPVTAKQLTVELRWKSPTGQMIGPASLTTFVYPQESPASSPAATP